MRRKVLFDRNSRLDWTLGKGIGEGLPEMGGSPFYFLVKGSPFYVPSGNALFNFAFVSKNITVRWNSLKIRSNNKTSWLNCVLRDDEAAYWVIIGHYEAVADGN